MQISTFTAVETRKRELIYRCTASLFSEAQDEYLKMTAWQSQNLPHVVVPNAGGPYNKAKIRRWLNRTIQGNWAYGMEGVHFSDEKDAFWFKLYWG